MININYFSIEVGISSASLRSDCSKAKRACDRYLFSIDIFSFHDLVYPPAAPVDVLVILKTSEKNNNDQIDDRVSKAMAGRSHES